MRRLWLILALLCGWAAAQTRGSGVPILGSTIGGGGGLGGGTCGTGATYAYSNSITIPAQGGMSADLSSFDLYLTGSTKWATVANGGNMQKADGSDLIFCTTASGGGGTQLYSERESGSYVATTGAGRWHVFLNSTVVSKTVTTTIYYYIGASGALDWSNPFTVPGSVATGVFTVGEVVKDAGGFTATLLQVSPFLINGYPVTGFDYPTGTWTGQSSAATFSQSAYPTAAVWPNYALVVHAGTPSSLSIVDSTNLYGGTNHNTATATTGQLGGAIATASASTQYITYSILQGGFNPLSPSGPLVSYLGWINGTSFPDAYNAVESNENGISSGIAVFVKSTGKLAIYVNASPNTDYDGTGTNTLSTGTTYLVGFSYNDTSHVLTGYVNGAQDATVTGSAAYNQTNATVQIGNSPFTPRQWNGWLDEQRVCLCTFSADYFLAAYNNQKPVGTFYTIN